MAHTIAEVLRASKKTKTMLLGFGTYNYGTCVENALLKAVLFGPKEQEKENEHVHMTSTAKVACTSALLLRSPARELRPTYYCKSSPSG